MIKENAIPEKAGEMVCTEEDFETTMPELYARWQAAFLKQLKKPDKDSPLVPPQNHYRKTYVRLANYIETKIRLRGGIDKVE